jgi:hypothetical protein
VFPSGREAGVEDYIVRIYRRKEANGGLFGVVEEVGVEGRKAFRSMSELVTLLRGNMHDESPKPARIRLSIPATVEGKDSAGKPFSENTLIEDVSPHGAWFRLKTRIPEGNELQLRILPTCCELRREVTVANVERGPEPWMVGVFFR